MKRFIPIALVLGSLLEVPVVPAQDATCGYTSYSSTIVDGDLIVPDNTVCQLLGSGKIAGNVTVGQNAGLVLEGGWTIGLTLQATGCSYVALNPYGSGSTVVGHGVQIENCTGNSPALGASFPAGTAFGSFGPSSLIGGSFQCTGNAGPCLLIGQHIGGGVHVTKNRSAAPSQIIGNFIAKNLYCGNNVPAPTGSSNWIAGNPDSSSEGQCTGF